MCKQGPSIISYPNNPVRIRTLRILVLLSFFHFSGLNNGFTFILANSPTVAPTYFAPVAIQNLCTIANPFNWGKAFQLKNWTKFLTFSTRAIEISSKNAIRRFHPRTLLQKTLNQLKNLSLNFSNPRPQNFTPNFPTLAPRPILLEPHSHASWRRTNEHKPQATPEIDLLNFDIQKILSPELEIKANSLIERQASLPAAERLQLWRHARGVGDASPNINGGFKK